jgi:pimeloyl-ACP methyl ester carboxylesterase
MGTITTRRHRDLLQGLGSGQPIVFSHGWPLSADDWDTQMLFFLGHGYPQTENPRRGPLLIMSGEKDHTVPGTLTNAAYKLQSRNEGVTELVEMPGRGHALTIDHGWREVAETARAFVRRFF